MMAFGASVSIAQPAEISVRADAGLPSDCINGLDGIVFVNNPTQLIISARSLNLQSGASIGFVIYSPDNSTVTDTVISSQMGSRWAGSEFWDLGTGLLHEHFGGGLPDSILTGGAALPGAGFQSNSFIDILTIDLDINEVGVICIDSVLVAPSGNWLMTPDGPPIWNGGAGDASVGGSSSTAFCLTVTLPPGESPCIVSEFNNPLQFSYQVNLGDTLVLLDSAITPRADFSVTTTGAGTADVDSAGYTTYIPSSPDLDDSISFELTYSLPTFSPVCIGPDKVFCTDITTVVVVLAPNCCDVPGDADHSGAMNIGDVTFMIARIFSGGPAPLCVNESDADGSGSFDIADVTFLIARIFSGGPAPVCGTVVN
jgi:hypothetical protein